MPFSLVNRQFLLNYNRKWGSKWELYKQVPMFSSFQTYSAQERRDHEGGAPKARWRIALWATDPCVHSRPSESGAEFLFDIGVTCVLAWKPHNKKRKTKLGLPSQHYINSQTTNFNQTVLQWEAAERCTRWSSTAYILERAFGGFNFVSFSWL